MKIRAPLSTVHPNSPRSVWRHRDSSEKTPSTIASDDNHDAAYIFPAAAASATSLPPLSVEQPAEEEEEGQDRGGRATPLTPLQPPYSPPKRTPTPDGLPSYEASQQAAQARLTRQLLEARLGIPPSQSSSSSRHRRYSSSSSRRPAWDAPLWRPPVSHHLGYGAGAEAEAEARRGREGRPVRLEDYFFLQELTGVGGGGGGSRANEARGT